MATLCRIDDKKAKLRLVAVAAQSGETIQEDLSWEIFRHNELVAESKEATPTFSLPTGNYMLIVQYKKKLSTTVENINLLPYTLLDQVIRIGKVRTPDSYHIDDETSFNPETEHERRSLDRNSQQFIGHDDVLKKPPTREQLRQQQQALSRSHLGPLSHPVLGQMVQFDGAVDPTVNPVPSENQDTINELYEEYQHQLQQQPEMQPHFNPKPSSPGI